MVARLRVSLGGGLHRAARLLTKSPFVPGSRRPLIVHATHHKAGTAWFQGVLLGVAERYRLKVQAILKDQPLERGVDIVLNQGSRAKIDGLALVRGSHMIRDPRDIAVSAYHYHLWTKERWAHKPREELGGRSYQQHLNALDAEQGLTAEIERLSRSVFPRMASWDYDRPDYIELRYEDVIGDEAAWFERTFRHYGFNDRAVAESLAIADRMSFSNAARRDIGVVGEQSHLRSGRPGQWRDEFTPDHIALFKRRAADLLIRLGYETDDRW